MEKYAKEGYTTFNLGGITNPLEKENKYKGLNDFKLGFGANAIEYIGDLELITNHPLYMIYRNMSPLRKKQSKKEN
jgi:lipid II:glycine glycyltransferase (peptidoglycan interpeptide bridge formation enzyme)